MGQEEVVGGLVCFARSLLTRLMALSTRTLSKSSVRTRMKRFQAREVRSWGSLETEVRYAARPVMTAVLVVATVVSLKGSEEPASIEGDARGVGYDPGLSGELGLAVKPLDVLGLG